MAADLENSVLVYDVGGSHISAAVCRNGSYRLGPAANGPHPAEEIKESFVHLLYCLGVNASNCGNGMGGDDLPVPGHFNFAAVAWFNAFKSAHAPAPNPTDKAMQTDAN